jgi:hypothetical protein
LQQFQSGLLALGGGIDMDAFLLGNQGQRFAGQPLQEGAPVRRGQFPEHALQNLRLFVIQNGGERCIPRRVRLHCVSEGQCRLAEDQMVLSPFFFPALAGRMGKNHALEVAYLSRGLGLKQDVDNRAVRNLLRVAHAKAGADKAD